MNLIYFPTFNGLRSGNRYARGIELYGRLFWPRFSSVCLSSTSKIPGWCLTKSPDQYLQTFPNPSRSERKMPNGLKTSNSFQSSI